VLAEAKFRAQFVAAPRLRKTPFSNDIQRQQKTRKTRRFAGSFFKVLSSTGTVQTP
jgi:hypothetical protein